MMQLGHTLDCRDLDTIASGLWGPAGVVPGRDFVSVAEVT